MFPVWLAALGLALWARFAGHFLRETPFLMDLDLFQRLGTRILSGQAHALYAPAGSDQALFKYGPCWALPLPPLSWMTHQAAAVLWASLTVAFVLGVFLCGVRLGRFIGLKPSGALAVAAVLLVVRPLTEEFLVGQTNVLWGLLTTAALLWRLKGRSWPAAALLALAISLKLPALLFALYLAARREWKLLARTGLCFLAFNGAAALLFLPRQPLQLFFDWGAALCATAPARAFEIGSQSLLALAGRLLRDDGYGLNLLALPDGAVAAAALALEAALFGLLLRYPPAQASGPRRELADWAILTTMMVVFSPTCWVATYSALLFPVWLALALVAAHWRAALRSPAVIIGFALTLALSEMTHSGFWKLVGLRYFKGESYVYLVFMILPLLGLSLGWLLWQLASLPRTSRS
ncbi:MAG: DUF2029 domain-containing protein [Candidatus Omnitrophica bacterium]|nr:DUF2029 domain-containing protein [Candidatus Omnitrophota bacterium]